MHHIVKSKLGCRLPKRSSMEMHSGVIYRIGNATFDIPKEYITIKRGNIKKRVSKLLSGNPNIEALQALEKLGVTCTKIS